MHVCCGKGKFIGQFVFFSSLGGYEVCVVIQRQRSQTQAAEFPLKGGRARS